MNPFENRQFDTSSLFKKDSVNYGTLQPMILRAACAVAGSTRLPVKCEDDWLELSVADLSKTEFSHRGYRLLVWAENRFMTAEASSLREPVSPKSLFRTVLENNEFFISSGETAVAFTGKDLDPRAFMHTQVHGLRLLKVSDLKKGDNLASPIAGGYVLPSSVPDVLGLKTQEPVAVRQLQTKVLKDGEFASMYNVRVPYVGNFVTSAGLIVRCGQ